MRPQFRLYGRVTKFLFPRDNLSSPARTAFNYNITVEIDMIKLIH